MANKIALKSGGRTTEAGINRAITKQYTEDGVFGDNDLLVVQAGTPNNTVKISVGDVIIGVNAPSATQPDYFYYGWVPSQDSVTITANVSGNPRIDAIVGYVDQSVTSTATDDNDGALKFVAVPGATAASPVAPDDAAIQTAVGVSNPWVLLAHVAVASGFSSIVTANITDKRAKTNTIGRFTDEAFADFVSAGFIIPTSANLITTIASGSAYIDGQRVTKPSVIKTFTASKDTYVDLPKTAKPTSNDDYTYTAVTNGAAAPALAASSIRIAKVVTSGTAVTSVTQTGTDSLSNKIRNTDPIILTAVPGSDGWKSVADTWTWASSDGPTHVVNAPSDASASYMPGVRTKMTQSVPLSASWNMDANSVDQKGGFNGTDTSVTYTSGKFSNAATYNGTTSKTVITDNATLKPTGPFTLGMWFKSSSTSGGKVLFQSFSVNTNYAGLLLQIESSNVLRFYCANNTTAGAPIDGSLLGTTNITDGVWHYVVCSYQNNYAQMYIDGKLEASDYITAPVYAGTNYVRIGCGNNSGTDINFMNGQIDDVFLINGYAVPEDWVAAKYAAQTAQGTSNISVESKFIITAITATTITMYGGTDYSLQNSAITGISYSRDAAPQGFPMYPDKWKVRVVDGTERSQSSPSSNTWYNLGSVQISVPIGVWNLSYWAVPYCSTTTAANFRAINTLSKGSSSESDPDMTTGATLYSNNTGAGALCTKSKTYRLTAKTSFFLLSLVESGASLGTLFNENSDRPAILEAVCGLL